LPRTKAGKTQEHLRFRPPKPIYGLSDRDKGRKHGSKDPPLLNMKNKKLNAIHVWKQMEDLAVPRLHLSVFDRAVYSHLLRHSRLEGRLELRFSILWLARGACLSAWAARKAVRRLIGKGALRLAERSRAGHVVKVRLPEEIRSLGAGKIGRAPRRVCLARPTSSRLCRRR